MTFSFDKSQDSKGITLRFKGALDENAALPDMSAPFAGDLILDLEEVSPLNSLGCRNWVLWIKGAKPEGKVKFVRCSPAVIGQANVLKGLIPSDAEVVSFFVPYHCPTCNQVQNVLVEAKSVFDGEGKLIVKDRVACERCGGQQAIDVIMKSYFNFMKR